MDAKDYTPVPTGRAIRELHKVANGDPYHPITMRRIAATIERRAARLQRLEAERDRAVDWLQRIVDQRDHQGGAPTIPESTISKIDTLLTEIQDDEC